MIKIENISKYFNGTKVLEDISTYFEEENKLNNWSKWIWKDCLA